MASANPQADWTSNGVKYNKEVRIFALLISFFVLFLPAVGKADLATSTNFILERGVIDTGGSHATSSGYGLETSIGQPGTGISSSTSFILRGGFLNFSVSVPSAATTTPTSTATTSAPGGNTGFSAPGAPATPPVITSEIIKACDFNDDSRCNIVDLSIMLYFYEERGVAIARYDLNLNLAVDFPDVSVLMYYWTG
ncbi:MAG: hypothetical protein UY56_C0014G0006 [Parcubacteria group bacterium GW2011_GWA1_50_14]|nr:MAG: hypothetical protein UY56_C0014G0006 [Parcubacteria group bacterium GW2011_GWA1_50_14]